MKMIYVGVNLMSTSDGISSSYFTPGKKMGCQYKNLTQLSGFMMFHGCQNLTPTHNFWNHPYTMFGPWHI